jgi:glycogenin glucosyltransferase
VLTRLNALRLGADGDLGCCYEKIGLLDADLLPIKYYDHLFRLKTPAGVINEHKDYFIEYDACGNYVLPSDFAHTGTWRWHCEYGSICGHGQPIPKRVTDRVCTDPSNMGIHGAIFMIKPDMREFQAIQGELSQSKICRRIGEQYPWPDMQYLTQRWSGYWTNVDLRFCGFKGYPTLSVLFGTHYAGIKPWQLDRSRKCWQWVRYEDFRYWFRIYNQMVRQDYPKLCKYPSLKKLLRCIHKLQGGRGAREQGGI